MSKIKIEIKSWVTGSILFEYERENNTIKDTLVEAVLKGADLRGADLRDADLRGADLRDAYLRGADLRDAYLKDADLRGAYLRDTDLRDAYLKDADLRGADLRDADLRGADLEDADLRGADLRDADLRDAYLKDADLEDADPRGADLRDAYLRGADLRDAYLRDAYLEPIKKDFFDVLLRAIPEIDNLKNAIMNGKIDGSTYGGECACLCGTLEKSESEKIKNAVHNLRDSNRPIERFFMGIKPGDIPQNNQFAKIAMEWIEEFEGYVK